MAGRRCPAGGPPAVRIAKIEFREYGTPGIARAQHIAAIALGDPHRAHVAEHALIGCLNDKRQLGLVTDPGLCHGWAGLVHTAHRAAADTDTHELATAATTATNRMRQYLQHHGPPTEDGFLEGTAGILLVSNTPDTPAPPATPEWDTCLLVNT